MLVALLISLASRPVPLAALEWLRRPGGAAAMAGGVALGAAAAFALGRRLTPFPAPLAGGELVVSGVYRWARHPMYGAVVLGSLGAGLFVGDWVALALGASLLPFFWAKSVYEERRLAAHFPAYAEYRTRVRRRLIPGVL